MAIRRRRTTTILDWKGLNSFDDQENTLPDTWFESINCVVSPTGSATALRSPANFNNALTTTNPILSAFDYDRNAGNLILFDIDLGGGGATVATYSTTGTTNTSERTGQTDGSRFKSLTVNDVCYRLNGDVFIQMDTSTNFYANGITRPASAPTASIVAGGAGALTTGITASYAYRNSVTGHISRMSAASGSSGATSGGNNTLRIAVTASSETGVDGIVLFLTEDGGTVRYLRTDSAGDPVVSGNTTGNIDIAVNVIYRDTLTPETDFNNAPPTTAFFMFRWRDRICLCDFRGATTRQQIQYNGYESCYYGIPWESWPSLNIINIPNKGDAVRGGIETPQGALILGEQDAYLLSGYPTDKVSSPEATVSVTEHLEQLGWQLGTRSPYTIANSPFGTFWLDQNKRIQLWSWAGLPMEVGLPMKSDLNNIQDTDAARNMAEAVWYQHGEDGGMFVLTASTTGSTNNRLFFITVYKDPATGEMVFAPSVSDIAAQCLCVADVAGTKRLFIGIVDRLREIGDLNLAGAGWGASQERYFSIIAGNEVTEFAHIHSISFDSGQDDIGVWVSDANTTNTEVLDVFQEEGTYFALVDAYGTAKRIRFVFPASDTVRRDVRNLRINYSLKRRSI